MANIKNILKRIRTAIYGIDVRNAIADGIEQCYIDAINADNKSMEVSDARGEYESLGERLNNMSINNSLEFKNESVETGTQISIVLKDKTVYRCNSIQSLSINSSTTSDINFKSRIIFEALNDFIVDSSIPILGDHCKNAKLNVKEGNKYVLDFIFTGQEIISLCECTHNNDGDPGDPTQPGEEDELLHDFYGAAEFIALAKRWHDERDKYFTYGQTNAFTSNGSKKWSEVTVKGEDSPDGRYRKIDCSGLINAVWRGLEPEDIYKDEATYNTKDLSARIDKYDWAEEPPRTAAEICKWCEEKGYALTNEQLHTEGTTDYAGLKMGDIIFRGGSNNGSYKGVFHVEIYYGEYTSTSGTKKYVIIEATSSTGVSKHSDGITKGIQILSFNKKSTSDIVCVARPQKGSQK